MTAHVQIELDTTAPAITIEGPLTVTPPADMVFTIRFSEPIWAAAITFTDSTGIASGVGYSTLDDLTIEAKVPTSGISGGEGVLGVMVSDQVANMTFATRVVVVNLPSSFDVVVTVDHGFGVEGGVYRGYDVALTI